MSTCCVVVGLKAVLYTGCPGRLKSVEHLFLSFMHKMRMTIRQTNTTVTSIATTEDRVAMITLLLMHEF